MPPSHFPIPKAFASAGINVIWAKPLAHTSEQARELVQIVKKAGVVFAVTYNYSGYPMVKHAAHLVRAGTLGVIRKVFVEYHQGWLATALDREGHKQALLRADPALAGAGGLGDIGTHAENLVSTVTGLEIESLCAEVNSFVAGRRVDDDAAVLLRFKGGARGEIAHVLAGGRRV